MTDNCWICDGWEEVEFEVKETCNDAFMGKSAFLHLDFEDFRPMYMDPDVTDQSRFVLRRMCPPNRKVLFFFTDPCERVLFESSEYERADYHWEEKGDNSSHFRTFTMSYLDGTKYEYIIPTTVNCITTKLHKNIARHKGDYDLIIKSRPREDETYFKINFSN